MINTDHNIINIGFSCIGESMILLITLNNKEKIFISESDYTQWKCGEPIAVHYMDGTYCIPHYVTGSSEDHFKIDRLIFIDDGYSDNEVEEISNVTVTKLN